MKRSGLLAACAAAALFAMPAMAADETNTGATGTGTTDTGATGTGTTDTGTSGTDQTKDDTSAMPTPVEGVDTNAPLEGANSFTEAQVTSRLQDNGFTEVTGLMLDEKGIWRGKAKMNNTVYDVAVDYRGNIVYGGTIMAKPE